jgi:hypothetical protein
MLRRRSLDKAGLPYLSLGLDPSWRARGDLHRDRVPRTGDHSLHASLKERLPREPESERWRFPTARVNGTVVVSSWGIVPQHYRR